jgi:hypothetical protein
MLVVGGGRGGVGGGDGDGSTAHAPLSIFCPFKKHTALTEAMNVL